MLCAKGIRNSGKILTLTFALGISLSVWGSLTASAQESAAGPARQDTQEDLVDVSTIELLKGLTPGTFALRIRCDKIREYHYFWVENRTFVLDIRQAYMPYRGHALGELQAPEVAAIKASQFMEGPIPIARIEVEVRGPMGADAWWTSTGLEVFFGPVRPGYTGTARTGMPGAGAVEAVRPTDVTEEMKPPTSVTPDQRPAVRAGERINPFDPLLKAQEGVDLTNTITRPLPDAELLTVTAISYLENRPDDSVAILRDGQGRNYLLKKGDRVRFGYVSSIGPKEVVFSLDKYGRRITVTKKYNP